MPGWLLGLISGVVVVYLGDWLRERRERRNRGNHLLAKLHVLVEEIRPEPILHLADLDQARAERAGADLWRRWRELQEALHVFAFESGQRAEDVVKKAATGIAHSIQATPKAVDAADDPQTRRSTKTTATAVYEEATLRVDDLDQVFAGRSLGGLLRGERRRRPAAG